MTLINYVLSAIPRYWMSIFQLAIKVIKKIDIIYREFVWNRGR